MEVAKQKPSGVSGRKMISVDEYRYSKRKTLAVCIDAYGRVIVRAPKNCPRQRIDAFLADKERWIQSHAEKRKASAAVIPTQIDGYQMPFAGERLTLCIADVKRIERVGETLYLPREKTQEKLQAWLKKQALSFLSARTIYWQQKMDVACKALKISSAKRKWGSCSSKDEIRYSYRLIYAPIDLIDYVVVHELSHIRYKNHSTSFWWEVAKYMPDYALRRARLKEKSALLEIF